MGPPPYKILRYMPLTGDLPETPATDLGSWDLPRHQPLTEDHVTSPRYLFQIGDHGTSPDTCPVPGPLAVDRGTFISHLP